MEILKSILGAYHYLTLKMLTSKNLNVAYIENTIKI